MKLLSYILIHILILRPVMPIVDYVINYKYIATQLCENRSLPELACNGKCHLKKELAKVAENDVPSTDKKNHKIEIPLLYLEAVTSLEFGSPTAPAIEINRCDYNLYAHLDAYMVFHPPIS